ncbi:MAG: uroporphyrinogen-III synthase [Oceanospirillaceae bacterium]|nr:uroporphyrinogen-III synthase [Oceanospirillaceae bacterium]
MDSRRLHNQQVLITRATHRQTSLGNLLATVGALAVPFPCLEIAPHQIGSVEFNRAKQYILELDSFDIVICISANAARLGGELIDQYWPQLPIDTQWFAIGSASAEQLAYFDIDAQQPPRADSESLLELLQLQQLSGKKILILQGNSGRKLLSKTLSARSAVISQCVLYNRIVPVYTNAQVKNSLYNSDLSAILITSGEALCNLTTIARGSLQSSVITSLLATQLIVPSTRVAKIASTQGYQHIEVAAGADDQSMLNALLLVRGLEADNEEKR